MSILSDAIRRVPGAQCAAPRAIALVGVLLALCGCTTDSRTSEPITASPPPSPVEKPPESVASAIPPTPTLSTAPSVEDLVSAAKRLHPTARAVAAAQRAADARIAGAGAWANPELELSYGRTRPRLDDLSVDRPYGAAISQRVEWWSKRNSRIAAAQADAATTQADAAAALLELDVEVRLAAISYTTAKATLAHATAQVMLATELVEVVAKRQAAGDIDLGEAARMRVEASTARVRQEVAQRAVATTLAVLRTWCGEDLAADLTIRTSDAAAQGDAPASVKDHPRLQAARAAERAGDARLQEERDARLPDVTIGVFGEREWEKDTYGVTLGIDVPLWNRNASGIAAAQAERERLAAARQTEELRLQRERAQAIGDWQEARGEATALRSEALPAAEDAVRLRTTAFTSGDASLADVLDARRALVTVQADLVHAERRMAEAQVRLLAATAHAGNTP